MRQLYGKILPEVAAGVDPTKQLPLHLEGAPAGAEPIGEVTVRDDGFVAGTVEDTVMQAVDGRGFGLYVALADGTGAAITEVTFKPM